MRFTQLLAVVLAGGGSAIGVLGEADQDLTSSISWVQATLQPKSTGTPKTVTFHRATISTRPPSPQQTGTLTGRAVERPPPTRCTPGFWCPNTSPPYWRPNPSPPPPRWYPPPNSWTPG
ncbi:hypothetical protein B0H63DRAFT_485954 [Podospora didyma]|uniref:Uncharacterized protein n=1 Tax=Podospora didyma TaxID=330526 RepID=A0AAE0K4Z7_9PEZI|nr:hypothetical protein B0H63DRAFT_485954 [Podospora didyma]